MRDWIVFFVLYGAVLALFRYLGGLHSAGEAMRMWAERRSRVADDPGSS